MKTFILSLTLLIVTSFTTVHAQTFSEFQTFTKVGDVSPLFQGNIAKRFPGTPLKVWTYYNVSENWAEVLVGPSVVLSNTTGLLFEGGVGVGLEQAQPSTRIGMYGYLSVPQVSLLAFYENGGSGYWYLGELLYSVSQRVDLGLHVQRYYGIGPRIDLNLNPFTIWVAGVFDPEDEWGGGIVSSLRINLGQ